QIGARAQVEADPAGETEAGRDRFEPAPLCLVARREHLERLALVEVAERADGRLDSLAGVVAAGVEEPSRPPARTSPGRSGRERGRVETAVHHRGAGHGPRRVPAGPLAGEVA